MNITELNTEQEYAEYHTWQQVNFAEVLWQSKAWKHYQQSLGKRVRLYVARKNDAIVASAMVVIDTTALNYSTWEIPRGPLFTKEHSEAAGKLVERITQDAKVERCLQLYVSPLQPLPIVGFRPAKRLVYPEATTIVAIHEPMETLLTNMKPKGRYNIKVAQKNNVRITPADDVQAFIDLHRQTAQRNRFSKPNTLNYKNFLLHVPGSFLLYAYVPSKPKPIAGLIGAIVGQTGIYYYGASDYSYRNTMAPYALQYAAIEHCKTHGCTQYDLFGIAPPNAPSHAWAGVTRFKQQFGGVTIEYPPELQITLRPLASQLLQLKRRFL